MWSFDQVITCNNTTIKKQHIFTSKRPIVTKIYKVVAFGRGLLNEKLHESLITRFHELKWKIKSIYPANRCPPLRNMLACCLMIRDPRPQSQDFDFMVTVNYMTNEKCYPLRCKYRWEVTTNKATWPFDHVVICGHFVTNKKQYIFTSSRSMATKRDKMVTYDERSQNMFAWDHKTNEKRHTIFPQILWQAEIAGWCLELRNH